MTPRPAGKSPKTPAKGAAQARPTARATSLPADAVEPGTLAAWGRWLAANHARSAGIWLVTRKKAAGPPWLSYDEVVTEALAWGWVDSKPRALDAERTMLWFAPRKAGSGWSAANKVRLARLEADGKLMPPGRAKVEAAKADGSWTRLDAVDALEVPPDLAAALRRLRGATANFAAFPRSVRRGLLEWVVQAKRPETRAARVREIAEKAAVNERANQWRGKDAARTR